MMTIGHHNIWHRFERTLSRGRLASTYLFVGPDGVGKRTLALDLAAGLLCLERPTEPNAACGRCESCQIAQAGAHPDLIQVARPPGKSSLPLELFIGRAEHRHREGLCHELGMKPFLSGRRIAIIDDADHLSVEGANCLLKTLEEPPPRSVMILIGTSLAKQLPTIRSRSQVMRFDRLSDDELRQVLNSRGLLGEDDDIEALVAAAEGSVAGALAAADQELVRFRHHVESTLAGKQFDPIRFAGTVIEQSQSGGAEPATRRQRLRTIIGYAIDHDRRELRGAANQGFADVATLRRLECSLSAVEAIDRNANQATVVQDWLVSMAVR